MALVGRVTCMSQDGGLLSQNACYLLLSYHDPGLVVPEAERILIEHIQGRKTKSHGAVDYHSLLYRGGSSMQRKNSGNKYIK